MHASNHDLSPPPSSTLATEVSASLTPFQRILLGTDGTVTHLLEVYAGEPVEVVKLRQDFDTSDDGDAPLDLSRSDKVLRRRVLLRGARSGRTLLHAEAVVVLDRVDAVFLHGLMETDKPIGTLLTETRAETFREILLVGRRPGGASSAHFDVGAADEVIFRTYRIVARRKPIVLITETFPAGSFRDLRA